MKNTKITPLYERLSRDDDQQGESNSISNQKQQQMPEGYKDMKPQELRKELGAIRAAAGEVISCMTRFFEAQQRSQKSRDQGAR